MDEDEYYADSPSPPDDWQGEGAGGTDGLTPAHWMIVVVLILAILSFVGMSENTAIEPAHIVIGGYNAITITLIALIGITGLKVLVNYVHIPGLTDLVNAA